MKIRTMFQTVPGLVEWLVPPRIGRRPGTPLRDRAGGRAAQEVEPLVTNLLDGLQSFPSYAPRTLPGSGCFHHRH